MAKNTGRLFPIFGSHAQSAAPPPPTGVPAEAPPPSTLEAEPATTEPTAEAQPPAQSHGEDASEAPQPESAASARERALLEEAGQATASKDYLRAAECYAEASELFPDRLDYRMMAGHCLKDARDYEGAFEAYSAALAVQATGDVYVQLGHLFKITGNIKEEEWAYQESARLGEVSAYAEIANLGSASAAQLNFFRAPPQPEDLPAEAFWDVILCRRGNSPDHGAIANAGKALALHGQADIARAFLEIAYLVDDAGAFRQEHYSLVQRTGLWPPSHLSELVKANVSRADRRTTPARVRLQRLIPQILAGKDADGGTAPGGSPVRRESEPDWPPAVLASADFKPVLDRLTAAIDRLYQAIAAKTPISGAAVIEAVRGLEQAVIASDHVVTFPNSADVPSLRLVSAGVLNTLARRWLRDHANRFIGAYVRPEQVAADLSLGGNPLADLIAELGSASAAFEEIDRQLVAVSRAPSSADFDRFFSRVAATAGAALTVSQMDDVLQEAIQRRLRKSVAVLAWNWVVPDAPAWKITHYAQKLKEAGDLAFAYELMQRGVDEKDAPKDYLVEKALLAKVNGDFATAARLFETIAAAIRGTPSQGRSSH